MPILQVNASASGMLLAQGLEAQAAQLAAGAGPIVILLHGFKFAPGQGDDCPHRHILALDPQVRHRKAQSWPRGLGIGPQDAPRVIAFGWQGLGRVRQAWDHAAMAGHALAQLVTRLQQIAPHRPVQAMAHSMGARVVLSALPLLDQARLSRAVLLNAASYQSDARHALTSAGGAATEVFNITTRENDLFDLLLECCVLPRRGDRCLGAGLPDQPNLVTLQLDDPRCLSVLARLGYPVPPADRRICHWSTYLRPGTLALYRALLLEPHSLPLDHLRRLLPADQHPRWSRLLAPPAALRALARRARPLPLPGTPA